MYERLWTETVDMPDFPELDRDETTDVLIVGAGMTGILCADLLRKEGISCLVCEAAKVGRGTSAGTTAVVSAQHDLYLRYVKKFGWEKAGLYLKANLEAVEGFRQLCGEIDCDFETCPSFLYTTQENPQFHEEISVLKKLKFSAKLHRRIPIPGEICAAVEFPAQAQFHPLKFIAALSNGIQIRQGAQIIRIEKDTAFTKTHRIHARKILIAAHYSFLGIYGFYPLKLYQKRSYVLALENAAKYEGNYVQDREDGFYFRNYKDLLLVGGGDHRTGKAGGGYAAVRAFVQQHYPDAIERFSWSTQDCMSLDGIPYIGPYSRSLKDVYVASGFNEWGMTNAMTAARVLCVAILDRPNPYATLFSPQSTMLTPQLFSNIAVTLCDYLLPTAKRCPHMGCALCWNSLEHSWDCPCHGSRFSEDGSVLDNPATQDAKLN